MARVYAEALATQVTGGRLVAVAGGTRAASLAAEYGIDAEASGDALIARPDIDAVVIATPHTSHLPYTRAAAAAGKHVYCEKPMAVTTAECTAMIRACRDAGVLLTVAKQSRQNETTVEAKRLIDAGTIGEVRMIRILASIVGWDVAPDGWIVDPNEGGAYLDWGVHGCDALRWITGSNAVRAYATFANYGHINAPDPSVMVQYELDSGVMVQLWMSYEMPAPGLGSNFQFTIVGATGIIELDRYGVRLGRGDGWETLMELDPWNWARQPKHPHRIALSARQVQDFVDAIRDGRQPGISGEEGRAAVEMIEAARRSAATHQAVEIPLRD